MPQRTGSERQQQVFEKAPGFRGQRTDLETRELLITPPAVPSVRGAVGRFRLRLPLRPCCLTPSQRSGSPGGRADAPARGKGGASGTAIPSCRGSDAPKFTPLVSRMTA